MAIHIKLDAMTLDELLRDWVEALSQFGIGGIIVLGPDPFGGEEDRLVLALSQPEMIDAAKALAESREFGSQWRAADAPLVLSSCLGGHEAKWRTKLQALGFQSFVRVAVPLPLGRMFECYLFSGRDLGESEASLVAWSAQSVWPTIKRALVKEHCRLSKKEIECLTLTVQTMSPSEIGQLLGCAERTVHFHLSNAMKKLQTDSKLAAMQRAMWSGLF